ncbi:efflux RND transporter permease subunit [Candidatus Coxiella mudrowiae]|uniref:efflux RND transporter permease subunit n=1 Tax=Candidatus Coxiella mudrowiae TaxID=2054173 RepID=UPI003CC82DEE
MQSLVSSVGQGVSAINSSNIRRLIIHLKPTDQRKLNANQIIQQLRQQLKSISGLKVFLTNPPAIRIGGKISNSNYQYVLQSTDWDSLETRNCCLKNCNRK